MLKISYKEYKEIFYAAMDRRRYAKFIEENQGVLYKPQLFQVDQYKAAEFTIDNFIAICDIHVPCTDYDFAMLPAAIARKHLPAGERFLVVHGDVFNADAFSRWPKLVKVPTWAEERDAGSNLFAIWAKTFDKIFVMPGNHDYRVLTRLDGEISFPGMVWDMASEQDSDLKQMFGALFSTDRLSVSSVDHCFINTTRGRYTVMHGTSYGKNPLTNANEYSQRYQSHIISGHEHHIGITKDLFDRYWLINNGGLYDPNKLSYVSLQASKKPVMKKGFTMVRKGYPTPFGDWIDWNEWL